MGAWGETAFENDSAQDWLAEFEVGGVATLRSTLSRVADTDDDTYLDVDDGSAAIAAAEIVAAALGLGAERVTKSVRAWLEQNPGSVGAQDGLLAMRAVQRVLAPESELRGLWDENGPDNPCLAQVLKLLSRLGAAIGAEESTAPSANARKTKPRGPVGEREKQGLVTFLRARGLIPTAEQMARIEASQDLAEIHGWLARAPSAPSVAALLGDS